MVQLPESRNSRFWDKQLEDGLPDSRLRAKPTIVRGRMLWEKVYCANCGCDGGLVTAEWSPHVFYQCQQCADKLGAPPGLKEAPEDLIRGKATG